MTNTMKIAVAFLISLRCAGPVFANSDIKSQCPPSGSPATLEGVEANSREASDDVTKALADFRKECPTPPCHWNQSSIKCTIIHDNWTSCRATYRCYK